MHIHFNHHISCIGDIISMIRNAHPDVTVSASHARKDHGLEGILDRVIPEMPANADGSMPEGYVEWLIDVAANEGADVVIPYRHRIDLSGHMEAFAAKGMRLLTCGLRNVMDLLENKPDFLGFARDMGVSVSPFSAWTDSAGLKGSLDAFPDQLLCIKPAQGIYGEGFRILYDQMDKDSFRIGVRDPLPRISVQALCAMVDRDGTVPQMMTMPFLPGVERSVDFACLDGRMLGAVTRTKHGTLQHVGHDLEAATVAALLAASLGLSGLVNLQTLEDRNGTQHLLELNSRAAGGIGMTIHSRINLPGLLVSGLKGDRPASPVFPDSGIDVRRRHVYEPT